MRVETNWPVLTQIAEHAGMMLNRYHEGRDGRTAYRRTIGKACVHKVVDFGEQVHVKPKKDHSRWRPWLRFDPGP